MKLNYIKTCKNEGKLNKGLKKALFQFFLLNLANFLANFFC